MSDSKTRRKFFTAGDFQRIPHPNDEWLHGEAIAERANKKLVEYDASREQAIEGMKVRLEGMILSLKKHGQNIDVQFHIDWLEKALANFEKVR